MASIELDIIKQRIDKLIPEEKRELIEYLAGILADGKDSHRVNDAEIDLVNFTDDDLKVA